MAAQALVIVSQLTSTIVLARLLTPDDYGVIAMTMAIISFAGLFRELGLSSAAIQNKNLTRQLQCNLFWTNITVGLLLTLITYSIAPAVAWFYSRPELLPITQALSITFLISSFGTQNGADLVKNLKFGRKAIATVFGSLTTLIVAISLANKGYGYWSLVWSNLAGVSITSVLLVSLSNFRPGIPRKNSGLREALQFGANVTAFDVVNYFHRNLDRILIGKTVGSVELGFYSRAYSLLLFPIQAIRTPVNSVAFPIFSKLQERPSDLKDAFLRVVFGLACITMPLTAFLFGNSESVIELVLGKQWLESSPIFSVLAIAAFTQPVTGMSGSLLLSLGQSRRYFQCGLFNAVILSACFVAGLPWGALGVATAYAIGNYIILYPWLTRAFKNTPVTLGQFTKICLPPALSSAAAIAASMQICQQFKLESLLWSLTANLLLFLIFFLGFLTLSRTARDAFKGLLLQLRGWRGEIRQNRTNSNP
jgi:PST family polysaccharide transporter